MPKEFIDFECTACNVRFWIEVHKNDISKTVKDISSECCPNCGKTGVVQRIPTPDEYIV